MALPRELQKLLHAPLEEVLLKLYSATFLKWLYDVNLRQMAEVRPDALPPPDRTQLSGAERVPKKTYLIALLQAVLRDKVLGRHFYQTLPPTTREAISAVTWERLVNLAALEETLGTQVARVNPDERRIYSQPLFLAPEHGFLALIRTKDRYWDYYSYSGPNKPRKEDYSLVLPDEIRKAFKAIVPPPAGYELLPLDNLPGAVPYHYACSDKVLADLRLVAEYIAQGHLKYTKTERVAMPSLKTLRQITGGAEFFEGSEDSDLALLRTRLLVGGVAFAGDKERNKLLAQADTSEPVRELCAKVLASASFLHEELLGHLTKRHNRWCQYSVQHVKNLGLFFGTLPAKSWISWDNLRTYHKLREQLPSLFGQQMGGLQADATTGREAWACLTAVDSRNEFELVSEPLLKGYAFLLAAFGMAEIAYDLPEHATYHRPKRTYLTPYDGLRFVRLTPLGEFVFRRRDTFEVAGGLPTRSAIILDEARLLAICRNPDAITELTLGQFMEKLAPGRYRMTPKSLVGGCGSREDIEERIRLFRRVVSATPPPHWEEFFARTLARTAPLTLEPDYLVLKLGADEEIRRLIASDPVLRDVVLKVEGLRIAVRRSDLRKLAKRLEQFGYLSPIPSLVTSVD